MAVMIVQLELSKTQRLMVKLVSVLLARNNLLLITQTLSVKRVQVALTVRELSAYLVTLLMATALALLTNSQRKREVLFSVLTVLSDGLVELKET
jgi:hypothetical protein